MRITVLTLFPGLIDGYTRTSILGRAKKAGLVTIEAIDVRSSTKDKHKTADERPYGGGPGMVMKAEPILRAFQKAIKGKNKKDDTLVVMTDASGTVFTSSHAARFVKAYSHLIVIAGHYEGIDARVYKIIKSEGYKVMKFSIGPYVLTGGELPALVMIDAISRHISGVLGDIRSLEELRGGVGIPAFTRPEILIWPKKKGKSYPVPKVLKSGNHGKIDQWRRKYLPKP